MQARPITMEKPLNAKQQLQQAKNNERARNVPVSTSSGQSQSSNDDNQYNERKISYSGRKTSENHEDRRRQVSTSDKAKKLEEILNAPTVATDVDTGNPVFVDDRERQQSAGQNSTAGNPSLDSTRQTQWPPKVYLASKGQSLN